VAGSAGVTALRRFTGSLLRVALAWVLGVAGLAAYNWWILVPLTPGLMTSPDQLFSDLEVNGNPYASVMQHCDLASGLLLLAAFLVAGYWPAGGAAKPRANRSEWLAILGFAVGGGVGGAFPEVCEDGVSAACRRLEWHFQLPASQYIHIVAGIIEFACITIALFFAARRTRGTGTRGTGYSGTETRGTGTRGTGTRGARSRVAATYRSLTVGAIIAYPLLGLAYLVNRLGGVMEGVFFIGFTVMIVAQLAERTAGLRARLVPGPADRPGGRAPELAGRGN
jgi:hypothetical protein